MPRVLTIITVSLLLTATSAFAADKSSDAARDVVQGGGLMCFSLVPPRDRAPSCDQLCAAKSAICVSLKSDGGFPSFGCADPLDQMKGASAIKSCRCCAIQK
jgi:hypothetical protein